MYPAGYRALSSGFIVFEFIAFTAIAICWFPEIPNILSNVQTSSQKSTELSIAIAVASDVLILLRLCLCHP